MQNRKEYLQELAHKMKTVSLTDKEQAFFDTWYSSHADEVLELPEGYARNPTEIRDRILIKLKQRVKAERKSVVTIFWRRIAAAASILIFLSSGVYLIFHKQTIQQVVRNTVLDIAPGSNKATLTLANGQQVLLTKNMTGRLAMQGQTLIQMNNGTITYAGVKDSITAFNTLTTKRKEQFPLILADGTEVTLDAASSITYPVAFNGKERRVKITGQVYFKVVHDDYQPFIVEVRGQMIRDIGTEFNINAYNDEPVVKTTLVEGSIVIAVNDRTYRLKSGQEADLSNNILVVKSGNVDEAIAWKNNLFHFTGVDLRTMMRQFSRWYDVDVIYQGEIPDHEFAGEMSRNVKASEVFGALGRYGLNFKIDGKNIIVSKTNEKQKDN